MRAFLSFILIVLLALPVLALGSCVVPAFFHDLGRGARDEAMSSLIVGGVMLMVAAPLALAVYLLNRKR